MQVSDKEHTGKCSALRSQSSAAVAHPYVLNRIWKWKRKLTCTRQTPLRLQVEIFASRKLMNTIPGPNSQRQLALDRSVTNFRPIEMLDIFLAKPTGQWQRALANEKFWESSPWTSACLV